MNSASEPSIAKKDHLLESRIIAAIIDILVLLGLEVILTGITGGIDVAEKSGDKSTFTPLSGVSFWLFLLVVVLYNFLQEAWSGQTLGKRIMKVRVVAADGDLTKASVLVRTLLRFVDFLPFFYLMGFLLVLVTPGKQRLGDLAAGTTVKRA